MTAEMRRTDKGYDSHSLLEQAHKHGMKLVIPPKKNCKEQREYDKEIYQLRHLIENAFLHLRWRGITTRHAKNFASVHIRGIDLWRKVI